MTLEQIAKLKDAKNILDSILNGLIDKETAPTVAATFKGDELDIVDKVIDEDLIVNDLIRTVKNCYTESTEKTQKTQVSIILNQLAVLTNVKDIAFITLKDLEKLSVMDIVSLNKTAPLVVLKLLTFCKKYGVNFKDFTGWSSCFKGEKVTVTEVFKQEQEELMNADLKLLEKIDYVYNEQFEIEEEIDNALKLINRCKNRLSTAVSKIKLADELA